MMSTRKSIVVSLAGLLLAWGGLALAWAGTVEETNPASLVPVIIGIVLIFLPAILKTWVEDRERMPERTARSVRGAGIAAGIFVGGYILYLWMVGTGDAKLSHLYPPVFAATAGVFALLILEITARAVLKHGTEK